MALGTPSVLCYSRGVFSSGSPECHSGVHTYNTACKMSGSKCLARTTCIFQSGSRRHASKSGELTLGFPRRDLACCGSRYVMLHIELYLAVLVQESHYRITNLFKFLCTEIWSPIPSAGSWKLLGSDTNARDYFDKTVPNWVLEIDAREFLGSPRVLRADLILNFRDDDNDTFPWACNWRVLYLQREIR